MIGLASLGALVAGEIAARNRPQRQQQAVIVPVSSIGKVNSIIGETGFIQAVRTPSVLKAGKVTTAQTEVTVRTEVTVWMEFMQPTSIRAAGQQVSFTGTLSGQHPHAGQVTTNTQDAAAFGSIVPRCRQVDFRYV